MRGVPVFGERGTSVLIIAPVASNGLGQDYGFVSKKKTVAPGRIRAAGRVMSDDRGLCRGPHLVLGDTWREFDDVEPFVRHVEHTEVRYDPVDNRLAG